MKHRLTYLIAFLGYYLGLDALFYFLNRRCKRVLTFHNVLPERDIEIASEAGYPAAYSNLPEINPRLGRYFLPRFAVSSDKIMLHFHLSGFRRLKILFENSVEQYPHSDMAAFVRELMDGICEK